MPSVTIGIGQTLPVTANPVDGATPPNPGKTVDSNFTWSVDPSSPAGLVMINPTTGPNVNIKSVGGPGNVQINVSGQSNVEIKGAFSLNIAEADAVGFTFTFGTPF